jgi:hypothetical protein
MAEALRQSSSNRNMAMGTLLVLAILVALVVVLKFKT